MARVVDRRADRCAGGAGRQSGGGERCGARASLDAAGFTMEGRDIREILAQEFASTAAWRRGLAKRYPQESANLHSASALEQLAESVRLLPEADAHLDSLAALNRDPDFFALGGEDTRYLIDQYGFQSSPRSVTAGACTAFLAELVATASDDDADRIKRQDSPRAE